MQNTLAGRVHFQLAPPEKFFVATENKEKNQDGYRKR
jgi:hypothetical protein